MKFEDYKVDKELVTIEITLTSVRFDFMAPTFEVSGFCMIPAGETYETGEFYDPWKRRGNLNLLWPLIDVRASHARMDEISLKLFFDNGVVLECRNISNFPDQVDIWGGESPEGGILLTSYPNNIFDD